MVLVWTMVFTIARGIRLPNEFAQAHWLLDYRFGIIRRAALGSMVALIAHLTSTHVTQNTVHVLSAVAFGGFALSMLVAIWLILRAHDFHGSAVMMALAFASSPFLVMTGHLMGYLDQVLFLLAFVSILLISADRFWPAALIQMLAVLIHEGYVLTAFPAVCVAAAFRWHSTTVPRRRLALAQIAPLAVFVALAVRGLFATQSEILRAQISQHLAGFGFVPTRASMVAGFEVSTLLEFLRSNIESLPERCLDQWMVASVGPTLLALVYFIHVAGRWRPMTLVLLTAACLCPLLQLAVAFDTARIWTQTLGISLLVLFVASRNNRIEVVPFMAIIAIPALLLNAFTTVRLYDDEVERFDRISRLLAYAPALVVAVRAAIQSARKVTGSVPSEQ